MRTVRRLLGLAAGLSIILMVAFVALRIYLDRDIRLIVPSGFRGVLSLRVDRENGTPPEWELELVTYRFPASGELATANINAFYQWHKSYAEHADGTPCSERHPRWNEWKAEHAPHLDADKMVLFRRSKGTTAMVVLVGTKADEHWFWGPGITPVDLTEKIQLINRTRSRIPQTAQMDALFGLVDHFFSASWSPGKALWMSQAFLHGRYVLTMYVDVEIDKTGTDLANVRSAPRFELQEILRFQPGGYDVERELMLERIFREGRMFQFGLDEWRKVVEAQGDFAVVGHPLLEDAPAPGFEEYQKVLRGDRYLGYR